MNSLLIACATCASNFQDDKNAAGWSIMFLLGVIVAVLGGVGFFMFRLIRRSELQMDEAEA